MADEEGGGGGGGGKKKLIIIIVAVVLLLVIAIVAVLLLTGGEEEEAEEEEIVEVTEEGEPLAAPIFLPLDSYIVNLKDGRRYLKTTIQLMLSEEMANAYLTTRIVEIKDIVRCRSGHSPYISELPVQDSIRTIVEYDSCNVKVLSRLRP